MEQFPRNQRFALGTRLANLVVELLEDLVEATYAGRPRKVELLTKVNRRIEVARWLTDLILASHVERVDLRWPEGAEFFEALACPRGLPIGNLTSQFFANVYLDGLRQPSGVPRPCRTQGPPGSPALRNPAFRQAKNGRPGRGE